MYKIKGLFSFLLVLLLTLFPFSVLMNSNIEANASSGNGYVAVGEVDTEARKVAVLFGDGTVSVVKYTGTAPLPGAVYGYTVNETDEYTFSLLNLNWSLSHQLSDTLDSTGESESVFPGEWGLTLWNWGGFGDYTWSSTLFRFTENASIYVRYSETNWRVFKYTSGLFPEDIEGTVVSGYFQNPTYDGNHWVDLFVIGAYEDGVGIKPPTHTAGSSFNTALYAEYNVGDKDVVISASEPDPDPTTVPDPDPTMTVTPTPTLTPGAASGDYYSGPIDGYCAVGEVDEANNKVAALLDNGETATVKYTGKAPEAGAVYGYKVDNGIYKFALPLLNWENSHQLSNILKSDGKTTADNGGAWDIFTYYHANFQDTNPKSQNIYFPSTDMPIFIRYSETSWRFLSNIPEGRYADDTSLHGTTRGYFVPRYDPDLTEAFRAVFGPIVFYADVLIIGDYGENGILPADKEMTATFDEKNAGWDNGNIEVVIASSSSPSTADVSDIKMVVISFMAILSMTAVAVVLKQKKIKE